MPLRRKKRLSPVSEKRKRENLLYLAKRKAFLRANPLCRAVIDEVFCGKKATDVHHKFGRTGGAYLDELTWLALCRDCHRWIHENPKEARGLGLLA